MSYSKAARVFGCMMEPIFQNKLLSIETKRSVCQGVASSGGSALWSRNMDCKSRACETLDNPSQLM